MHPGTGYSTFVYTAACSSATQSPADQRAHRLLSQASLSLDQGRARPNLAISLLAISFRTIEVNFARQGRSPTTTAPTRLRRSRCRRAGYRESWPDSTRKVTKSFADSSIERGV